METDSHDHTAKIHRVALVNAKEFQRACYEVVIYVPTATQKVTKTSLPQHFMSCRHHKCMLMVGRLWLVLTES